MSISFDQVQDIVRYREGVEMLMKLQSDKPIQNSEPAHAAILYELFFKHAKDRVVIFCNKLRNDVFGVADVVTEAGFALQRGVKIGVMIQQDSPDDSAFLSLLRQANVPVLRAPKEVKNAEFNFAVMDSRSVRIEADRNQCKAQARMHAPELATALRSTFDLLALESTREKKVQQ